MRSVLVLMVYLGIGVGAVAFVDDRRQAAGRTPLTDYEQNWLIVIWPVVATATVTSYVLHVTHGEIQ